jgi:ATP-binding cassette subfamily B protein
MTVASSSSRAAALWRRLWSELSVRDRRRLTAAAATMLLASGLTASLPVFVGSLVDQSLARGSRSLAGSMNALALIGVLVIAAQLLQVVRRQLVEAVATGFERDAREAAYRHLLRLDVERLRENQVGRVYGRANRSIEGAVRLVKLGAMDLIPAVTLAVIALVVAITRAPLVAAAMVMVIPTGFGLVIWQVSSQAGVRLTVRDCKEDIDGQVVELLPALEVVRTTGAEPRFGTRIAEACGALRTTELRHHRAMSLFDAAKAINEGLWLVVTLAVAVGVTGTGSATAGQVTAIVLLYAGVTQPLRDLHRIIDEAAESAQQATDLFDLLDGPEDVSYRRGSGRPAAIDRVAPAVEMSGVKFEYISEDGAVPVLDGLTLSVAPGERLGIVGPSGCGKSTTLRLIARLLHTESGTIRIGGQDIRDLGRADLTPLIGYVPQHAQLFRLSVLDNILLGSPGATRADAERAARQAHLHAEIMRLPDDYDTLVSERGETLSGGQRQRLSLARALVRTPPILLLDEATSALDEEAQSAVSDAIAALKDVTLIVVAHRVTTLRTMHRIAPIKNGRLAGTLSYEELLARVDPPADATAELLGGSRTANGAELVAGPADPSPSVKSSRAGCQVEVEDSHARGEDAHRGTRVWASESVSASANQHEEIRHES